MNTCVYELQSDNQIIPCKVIRTYAVIFSGSSNDTVSSERLTNKKNRLWKLVANRIRKKLYQLIMIVYGMNCCTLQGSISFDYIIFRCQRSYSTNATLLSSPFQNSYASFSFPYLAFFTKYIIDSKHTKTEISGLSSNNQNSLETCSG